MTHHTTQTHASERGFTLVELAIVMIIIGLLIGGILKGQELIGNAKVSSTVAQVKAIESAVSAFRDKFAGMPGDLTNVAARIANCANMCATDGSGDSLVQTGTDNNAGAASANNDEAGVAFVQLGAAGMIGGVNGGATDLGNGISHPNTPIGGIWNFAYSDGALAATGLAGAANLTSGHYVVSANVAGAVADATTVPFQPAQAANIDRKIDDGAPNTGSVRAIGSAGNAAGNCIDVNTAAGIYREANDARVCGVFAKVQ